ncbi:MAG: VOC family protein [Pseudomonadota bacterium]
MKPNRLTLITLGVANLAASRMFYERLGLVADDSPPGVTFYTMRGFKFGLFPLTALAKELDRDPSTLGTGAMTLAVNWPSEDAVDDAYATAVEAGAKRLQRPRKMDWGGYSGTWTDPDHHVWEYAYNPFWPMDEDGWLV